MTDTRSQEVCVKKRSSPLLESLVERVRVNDVRMGTSRSGSRSGCFLVRQLRHPGFDAVGFVLVDDVLGGCLIKLLGYIRQASVDGCGFTRINRAAVLLESIFQRAFGGAIAKTTFDVFPHILTGGSCVWHDGVSTQNEPGTNKTESMRRSLAKSETGQPQSPRKGSPQV